ncbi:MAG: endonuclease III [Candidatus Altiarchaeales archaeon]|nr:endonuclease III [Candidatus Altiarchaeales archaeon]
MKEGNAGTILEELKKLHKTPRMELAYENPLQLLVATMLSAQCTDKRVNMVTEKLFRRYKTVEDYANADLKKFEQEIKSTGFYRNKARNIKNAAQKILKDFKGKVPETMEELLTLPGVARKTANIVLTAGYGIVEGIAVDTHVKRLSYRLGFSVNTSPDKIEQDLMKLIPKKDWSVVNMTLVLHGRYACQAKKPKCSQCVINKICPKKGVTEWR